MLCKSHLAVWLTVGRGKGVMVYGWLKKITIPFSNIHEKNPSSVWGQNVLSGQNKQNILPLSFGYFPE